MAMLTKFRDISFRKQQLVFLSYLLNFIHPSLNRFHHLLSRVDPQSTGHPNPSPLCSPRFVSLTKDAFLAFNYWTEPE
jgi:hypothetical protein